jgi:hypothetical protein
MKFYEKNPISPNPPPKNMKKKHQKNQKKSENLLAVSARVFASIENKLPTVLMHE